jgi:hypothetical protein
MAERNMTPEDVECQLLHGTRTTSPADIVATSGLDMRYSDQGMFGRAVYFTSNPEYVLRWYAHVSRLGALQVFVARVLRGRTQTLPPNRDLRRPGDDFDSVTGFVADGVQATMVYETYHAYPEYLVDVSASVRLLP